MKKIQSFYLDTELISKIDNEIQKIGCGASRSGWIAKACEEKLANKCDTIQKVISKLNSWQRSFPKRPFKELLEELQNGEI